MINQSNICLENVKNINLSGKGGKEILISQILTTQLGWERTSGNLFDFSNKTLDLKTEIKKQKNLQWFDPTKYANLTDDEKQIEIVFILIDRNGNIDTIFSTSTQDFVNVTWSQDYLQDAHNFVKKYPKSKAQIKYPIQVRDFFNCNREICEVLYSK